MPPSAFPTDTPLTIQPGESTSEIVEMFRKNNYVRSENILHLYLVLQNSSTGVRAGTYNFSESLNAYALAKHVIEIGPKEELVALTFPEGFATHEFAQIAEKKLEKFDLDMFLSASVNLEGFLFPETYFVPKEYSASQLLSLMTETYEQKILPFQFEIESSKLSEQEIVTLASIVEREANDKTSMRMVSGILQNRLIIGMPLQADATIGYVLDKPLSELVSNDLDIDSPYNTYLYAGLPPTPIGNPGLEAIEAVLYPTKTDNFYYITDTDGEFHYAKTFDQHRANIARYLK